MGCNQSTSVIAIEHAEQLAVKPTPCVSEWTPATPKFHQNYVLLKKLGKGAFARVYACQEVGSEMKHEQLAVKILDLRNQSVMADVVEPRLRRTAEKEMRVLQRIGDQTHCCRMLDAMICGHFYYMIMEKCDVTLLQGLERLPELSERTMIKYIREMFMGVAAVHALGIVHRDVKPDNFLVSGADSTVKLCDFGLAEVVSQRSEGATGVYGTAPFMAPEMLAGAKYSTPIDVWSLGVIVNVLLVGKFPYTPIEASPKAMKAAISSGFPEPTFLPVVVGVQISPEAPALLKALLCRKPQLRPSAQAALDQPWFSMESTKGDDWAPRSLRGLLMAAKRIGAFDVRHAGFHDKMDALDKELQALQDKYHFGRQKDHIGRRKDAGTPERAPRDSAVKPGECGESVTSTVAGTSESVCSSAVSSQHRPFSPHH